MKHLTNREPHLLFQIPNGKSNKQIPSSLFISQNTLKTHVSHLLSKLDLPHRTQPPLYPLHYQKTHPKHLL
ncbi:response regulator transcription factor [Bacillus pumilus]|uniref:response regulator transcription factor n=1 Tax=Bacillus pumilus TaxID=1408 RepID=UPI0021B66A29|nr:helix-turn-helix transcriptional regulator [Bacillus pumilus]